MSADYAIKRVTLDTVNWTAITAPFNCDNARIENEDDAATISVRTLDTDATTEKLVYPNTYFSVGGPIMPGRHPRFRFNEIAFYARVSSGVGPAVVEFY